MNINISGIDVQINKKNIKNMHLSVKPPLGNVVVSAPLLMSQKSIENFVRLNFGWIKKQQEKFANQPRMTARQYVSGETYYIWGKQFFLEFKPSQKRAFKIDGNKITVTMKSGNTTTVEEMTDITINGDDLNYTSKFTVYMDGKMVDDMLYKFHYTKVKDDYSKILIGRWEGTVTSDEPGFEPQPFCEEYLSNGTIVEYQLIDGQWVEVEAEYAEYFIDGNLLFTRWKYAGKEEERENCIIESYADGILTVKEVVDYDNHIYTYTNTLKKIVQ